MRACLRGGRSLIIAFDLVILTAFLITILNIVVGCRVPLQRSFLHELSLLSTRLFLFRSILVCSKVSICKLDPVSRLLRLGRFNIHSFVCIRGILAIVKEAWLLIDIILSISLLVVRIFLSLPVQLRVPCKPSSPLTHQFSMINTKLCVIHHRGLVEESCVILIGKEALLLAVEKHVPHGHEHYLDQLRNNQPLQPVAFLGQHACLVDAVLASRWCPD